jgi:hypothetical protein
MRVKGAQECASRGVPQLLVSRRDSGGARPEFGGDLFEALEESAGQDGSFEELEVGWGHFG